METKKTTALLVLIFLAGIAFAQVPGSAPAQGGNITMVNLSVFNETQRWQGWVGTVFFTGPLTPPSVPAIGGEINFTQINVTSPCTSPTAVSGFILFSNSSTAPTGLVAGNLTILDQFTGGGPDKGSSTFTVNTTFTIGAPITNVPTAYPYVNNGSQSTVFREGYLNDAGGNIVFAVEVNLNTQGYNSSFFDFQALLPARNKTAATWYLTTDLQINCQPITPPSGGGGGVSPYYPLCTPSWNCTGWGPCVDGLMMRNCTSNFCGRAIARPPTAKTCEAIISPEMQEPELIDKLHGTQILVQAPQEIEIVAGQLTQVLITIHNPNDYSIEDLSATISTPFVTQTYTPLQTKPKLYQLFGVIPKIKNIEEHAIRSRTTPTLMLPKETITLPAYLIGPPIIPQQIQAILTIKSGDITIFTQPIIIITEVNSLTLMTNKQGSTITAYILLDNREQKRQRKNLEIDLNEKRTTKHADLFDITIEQNKVATYAQTYRTTFDYDAVRARTDNAVIEVR